MTTKAAEGDENDLDPQPSEDERLGILIAWCEYHGLSPSALGLRPAYFGPVRGIAAVTPESSHTHASKEMKKKLKKEEKPGKKHTSGTPKPKSKRKTEPMDDFKEAAPSVGNKFADPIDDNDVVDQLTRHASSVNRSSALIERVPIITIPSHLVLTPTLACLVSPILSATVRIAYDIGRPLTADDVLLLFLIEQRRTLSLLPKDIHALHASIHQKGSSHNAPQINHTLCPPWNWLPYISVLPVTFDTPVWWTDDEISSLQVESIYCAETLVDLCEVSYSLDHDCYQLNTTLSRIHTALSSIGSSSPIPISPSSSPSSPASFGADLTLNSPLFSMSSPPGEFSSISHGEYQWAHSVLATRSVYAPPAPLLTNAELLRSYKTTLVSSLSIVTPIACISSPVSSSPSILPTSSSTATSTSTSTSLPSSTETLAKTTPTSTLPLSSGDHRPEPRSSPSQHCLSLSYLPFSPPSLACALSRVHENTLLTSTSPMLASDPQSACSTAIDAVLSLIQRGLHACLSAETRYPSDRTTAPHSPFSDYFAMPISDLERRQRFLATLPKNPAADSSAPGKPTAEAPRDNTALQWLSLITQTNSASNASTARREGGCALIPFFDLLNHHCDVTCSIGWDCPPSYSLSSASASSLTYTPSLSPSSFPLSPPLPSSLSSASSSLSSSLSSSSQIPRSLTLYAETGSYYPRRSGDQVFISYGLLINAKLLARYGFVPPPPSFPSISDSPPAVSTSTSSTSLATSIKLVHPCISNKCNYTCLDRSYIDQHIARLLPILLPADPIKKPLGITRPPNLRRTLPPLRHAPIHGKPPSNSGCTPSITTTTSTSTSYAGPDTTLSITSQSSSTRSLNDLETKGEISCHGTEGRDDFTLDVPEGQSTASTQPLSPARFKLIERLTSLSTPPGLSTHSSSSTESDDRHTDKGKLKHIQEMLLKALGLTQTHHFQVILSSPLIIVTQNKISFVSFGLIFYLLPPYVVTLSPSFPCSFLSADM